MLEGEFSPASGSPFIFGDVWVPRFNLTGGVHFCLDTGTDYTTLMPRDASSMGIDHAQLEDELVLATAGGAASVFLEPALVQFTDLGASRAYMYRIMMAIAAPSTGSMRVPSLLGRDIINRWRIDYHPTAEALTCEVITADETTDLASA